MESKYLPARLCLILHSFGYKPDTESLWYYRHGSYKDLWVVGVVKRGAKGSRAIKRYIVPVFSRQFLVEYFPEEYEARLEELNIEELFRIWSQQQLLSNR